MNKKAIIIDGNSLMFRAFYATFKQLAYYKANNQPPRNVLKTMSQMLFNLVEKKEYTHWVIAFDAKGGSFRNQMSENYKANRKRTPDELIEQIPLVHKACELMGFNVYCVPGIEADDVVGSASELLSSQGIDCDIFSSDKDLLQLVNEHAKVNMIKNGGICQEYNVANFSKLYYGLNPEQVKDFKAIAGDQSDNIPGVKGIGEKGAINLIKEFNSLENIYECLDKITSKGIQQKLVESKDQAILSKAMATIMIDYFKDPSTDQFLKKEMNSNVINAFFKENRINTLERYVK